MYVKLCYILLVSTDGSYTYRFDVEIKHLLHIGGHAGEHGVAAPVITGVGHHDRPHGWRRQYGPPRHRKLLLLTLNYHYLQLEMHSSGAHCFDVFMWWTWAPLNRTPVHANVCQVHSG